MRPAPVLAEPEADADACAPDFAGEPSAEAHVGLAEERRVRVPDPDAIAQGKVVERLRS